MKSHNTIAGKIYTVTSPSGCTVTDETGLQLGSVEAGEQKSFVATGAQLSVDDDAARVTLTFNRAASALGLLGGGVDKWGKYAKCVTVNDLKTVDANYKNDLTPEGEWKWKLPKLVDGTLAFYADKKLKFFSAKMPKLKIANSMFYGANVTALDFSDSPLEKVNDMCQECYNLTRFKGDLTRVTSVIESFYYCRNLEDFEAYLSSLKSASLAFDQTKLNKSSTLRILYSIPAWTDGASHPLTLGIHVDHQTDEDVVNAIAEAEAKGWTLTVQWNGTATAAAASTWGRRKPVFARLGEPMEDGTRVLDWGHYVTSAEENGYAEFASLEEAKEHFNITD